MNIQTQYSKAPVGPCEVWSYFVLPISELSLYKLFEWRLDELGKLVSVQKHSASLLTHHKSEAKWQFFRFSFCLPLVALLQFHQNRQSKRVC